MKGEMMPTSATGSAPSTLITLDTISAEIKFIADFMGDLAGKTASDSDKDRIKALLAAAQSDLAFAAQQAIARLGQNPVIGD
jgi:hypothetical protein